MASLTDEQQSVMDFLLRGDHVFLTGGGGVGKSYLLAAIDRDFPGMKHQFSGTRLPRIQMCALTGCAALLLGHKAKTLHSWAGIGLGKGTIGELYVKIRRNTKSMRNWLLTDLLIIDEVSMMTAELLDKLNELGKKIRKSTKPFGGMQVLLVGDFYQLPPVSRGEEKTQFAFESAVWKEAAFTCVELTIIQRQKDEGFQCILKEARRGTLSKESCQILREYEGRDWRSQKIRPTLLFPRRSEVELINDTNLKVLKGPRETYKARLVYDGKMPNGFVESDEGFQRALVKMDADGAYSTQLELVQGAQVMLIANIDPEAGLVNGSRGIVAGFCPSSRLPMVEFMNGARKLIGQHNWPIEDYEVCARSQIPLRLAWACTTHKAQGCSLDSALVDIGAGNFEYGQAYVALSRVRSLEALFVHDFDPAAFRAHPTVRAFYQQMTAAHMDPEERDRIRLQSSVTSEERSIVAEPSRPVQAIRVIKEEPMQKTNDELTVKDPVIEPGTVPGNWLYDSVPDGWKGILYACHEKLLELSQFLSTKTFFPPKEHIWFALEQTPLSSINIVILGQDPYPTPGNAHGLAFSVLPDVRPLPASLKNIYKELATDQGVIPPAHGYLAGWAKQGVLLLNTVLTVEAGSPHSHANIGWEDVTDQIIRAIAAQTRQTIFVLWGKSAQIKRKLLGMYMDSHHHRVIESAHPSPLSASKGFFGSAPFGMINGWLTEMGKEPIRWNDLPTVDG